MPCLLALLASVRHDVRMHKNACASQEFDGASRGNPGRAGAGAALLEDASNKQASCKSSETPWLQGLRFPVTL